MILQNDLGSEKMPHFHFHAHVCCIILFNFFHFSFSLSSLFRSKSKHGRVVDVRKPKTFMKGGFIPEHETAIIIHGFNGTQTSNHIMYLKDGKIVKLLFALFFNNLISFL
jgi:hypothetical protein